MKINDLVNLIGDYPSNHPLIGKLLNYLSYQKLELKMERVSFKHFEDAVSRPDLRELLLTLKNNRFLIEKNNLPPETSLREALLAVDKNCLTILQRFRQAELLANIEIKKEKERQELKNLSLNPEAPSAIPTSDHKNEEDLEKENKDDNEKINSGIILGEEYKKHKKEIHDILITESASPTVLTDMILEYAIPKNLLSKLKSFNQDPQNKTLVHAIVELIDTPNDFIFFLQLIQKNRKISSLNYIEKLPSDFPDLPKKILILLTAMRSLTPSKMSSHFETMTLITNKLKSILSPITFSELLDTVAVTANVMPDSIPTLLKLLGNDFFQNKFRADEKNTLIENRTHLFSLLNKVPSEIIHYFFEELAPLWGNLAKAHYSDSDSFLINFPLLHHTPFDELKNFNFPRSHLKPYIEMIHKMNGNTTYGQLLAIDLSHSNDFIKYIQELSFETLSFFIHSLHLIQTIQSDKQDQFFKCFLAAANKSNKKPSLLNLSKILPEENQIQLLQACNPVDLSKSLLSEIINFEKEKDFSFSLYVQNNYSNLVKYLADKIFSPLGIKKCVFLLNQINLSDLEKLFFPPMTFGSRDYQVSPNKLVNTTKFNFLVARLDCKTEQIESYRTEYILTVYAYIALRHSEKENILGYKKEVKINGCKKLIDVIAGNASPEELKPYEKIFNDGRLEKLYEKAAPLLQGQAVQSPSPRQRAA